MEASLHLSPLALCLLCAAWLSGCGQNPGALLGPGADSPDLPQDTAPREDLAQDAEDQRDSAPEDLPPEDTSPDLPQAPDALEEDVDATELPGDGEDQEDDLCLPQEEVCDGVDNDCDGVVDQGFNLESDPEHCGACGQACDFTGARGSCQGGRCVLEGCLPGWLDLDQWSENGCEAQVGQARNFRLTPSVPLRVVNMGYWYAVLDGEVVWLYLSQTHSLVDSLVLPAARDAAFDPERNLLAVGGGPWISLLDVTEEGLSLRSWLEAPDRDFQRLTFVGEALYAANNFNQANDSTLWVVDTSDPDQPQEVHREATMRAGTDFFRLDESHLVTVSASTGLSIYDISRPQRPGLLSFSTYQAWPSNALAVDPEAGMAAVASRYNGVFLFDISNPEEVRQVGQVTDLSPGQSPQGLHLEGDSLWVTDLTEIRRFDISNPAAPVRRVSQSLPGAARLISLGERMMMLVLRSWNMPIREYAINGGSVQRVYLDDLGASLSNEIIYDGSPHGGLDQAHRLGEHLLLVDESGQALLYDTTDAEFNLDSPTWQSYLGLYDAQVVGDKLHAVVSSYQSPWSNSDYVVWGVGDPALGLQEELRMTFPCPLNGVTPYDLYVGTRRAYVICGGFDQRDIYVLDTSDPAAPRYLGVLSSPLPATGLVATDQQLIVTSEQRINYRPTSRVAGYQLPVEDLLRPNWTWNPGALPRAMTLHQGVLYAALSNGELQLMDVDFRDAWSPLELPAQVAPPSTLLRPTLAQPYLLLPTQAGLSVMHPREPARAPALAGELLPYPVDVQAAAFTGDAFLLLTPRRVLRVPVSAQAPVEE